MSVRTVQLALGALFIAGATIICAMGGSHGWGWLIFGALLCIPGCMA